MSKTIFLNQNWIFSKEGYDEPVTLPHTWNAIDGQDGGNDYWRGCCTYCTRFAAPVYDPACWIHLLVENLQIYQFTFGSPKPNAHAKRPIFARILRNTVTLIK